MKNVAKLPMLQELRLNDMNHLSDAAWACLVSIDKSQLQMLQKLSLVNCVGHLSPSRIAEIAQSLQALLELDLRGTAGLTAKQREGLSKCRVIT